MRFSKRSDFLVSSPLYAFSKKVKEMEGRGVEVFSLGLGEPFYDTPEAIKKAGIEAIEKNQTHYNPAAGSMKLRQALAEKYQAEAANVAVSSGAKPILGAVFWSLLNEGDQVFLAAPFYPPFLQIIQSCGGQTILIDTKPSGFKMTVESLRSAFENSYQENPDFAGQKYLLVNSPNNPTGTVYDKNELKKIVEFCRENKITVISDECYNQFSAEKGFTLRGFSQDVIVINSLSKSHAMTGWRIGFVIAPKELVGVIEKFLENYLGCPCSISDAAALVALQTPALPDLTKQRQVIHAWLEKMQIPFASSEGGIFIFPDFADFMRSKKLKTSTELATYFLEKVQVATTPGISFGENYDTHLRLSYCLQGEKLREVLQKLEKAF